MTILRAVPVLSRSRALALALGVALLAALGCGRPSDVPHLEAEIQVTTKAYEARFDELARRAEAIRERGTRLAAGTLNSAEAQRLYTRAFAVIRDQRNNLHQVADKAQDAYKVGVTEAGRKLELRRLLAGLHQTFERADAEATATLGMIEAWLSESEQRPGAPPRAPAPGEGSDLPSR